MEEDTEKVNQFKMPSLIWDSEKKRPGKFFFIILIIITVSILTLAIHDTLNEIHEVRIVIKYVGNFDLDAYSQDAYKELRGHGEGEITLNLFKGAIIEIRARKVDHGPVDLTIVIYDNDNFVLERNTEDSIFTLRLEYRVGEGEV